MKYFITITFLIFSLGTFAQTMPKYLDGAEVTVTLKNGKTYIYKSEDMAVVPRVSLGTTLVLQKTVRKVKKLVKDKKNRLYGMVGQGPNGDLDVSTNGSRYKIEHDRGGVLGIGYQRKMTEEFNLGVQIQNNQTTSLTLGLDF